MPRDGLSRVGLDFNLHFAFDYDMMIRFLLEPHAFCVTDKPLVFFRLHEKSKTISNANAFGREGLRIRRSFLALSKDPSFTVACRKALRRLVWHRCVDRIGNNEKLGASRRIRQLVLLIGRRPGERLDRYALGRVRRLASVRPRS